MGRLSNHHGSTPPQATRKTAEHRGYCQSCGQRLPDTDLERYEPPADLKQLWAPVAAELRSRTPDFKYHIWLKDLELVGGQGKRLMLRAPEHIRSWVGERYLELIVEAAREAYGDEQIAADVVSEMWRPGPGEDRPRLVPPAGSLPARESPPRRRRRSDV